MTEIQPYRGKPVPVKPTQGNRKINQMLADLRRNTHFLRDLGRLRHYLDSETQRDMERTARAEGKVDDKLLELHEMMTELSKLIDGLESEYSRVHSRLCIEYGIDPELLRRIGADFLLERGEELIGDSYDMVRINDYYDQQLNPVFPYPLPPVVDQIQQVEISVYPVHLEIHKFATKRDVLDFIEKRWEFIEQYLSFHRGEKQVRIRQRTKVEREMADFIWERRKLPAQKIKDQLDIQFPKNDLVYFEISQILTSERKRRRRKITVGQ